MGTGAVSRYKLATKPGISHVTQNFIADTGAVSGWRFIRVRLKESSKFKNRDKQMTYIVRVIGRTIFFLKDVSQFYSKGNNRSYFFINGDFKKSHYFTTYWVSDFIIV